MFKTKKVKSEPRPAERSFTSSEIAEMTGVSLRQLQWWDEQKVVSPRHEGHKRVYLAEEAVEIAVIAELRRKGFSLQKIRQVLRFLQKEMGKKLVEIFSAESDWHLLTDGKSIYLEDNSERRSMPWWKKISPTTVTPDKAIYQGAIGGMLRTLDPHSSFFDPKDFNQLREDQRGTYYGVGMTVSPTQRPHRRRRPVHRLARLQSGHPPRRRHPRSQRQAHRQPHHHRSRRPAARPQGHAGPGQDRPRRRRNPSSSTSPAAKSPATASRTPSSSSPASPYMDIESFNENTSREMDEAFKRLGEDNVKGLVLDLRDNPGGLLNEGVAVAGRFLKRGQTVVSHRGRAFAREALPGRNGSTEPDYPIVVIVNRYSASAAEIVAGALQDHDRGWVLGDNTFGKGLVQTVFPLTENTGLALTTPSTTRPPAA
jgi:C-terminal processing protease CtpA/Prc